jgi:hypothetical protein
MQRHKTSLPSKRFPGLGRIQDSHNTNSVHRAPQSFWFTKAAREARAVQRPPGFAYLISIFHVTNSHSFEDLGFDSK